jgi:hypothetical protein
VLRRTYISVVAGLQDPYLAWFLTGTIIDLPYKGRHMLGIASITLDVGKLTVARLMRSSVVGKYPH